MRDLKWIWSKRKRTSGAMRQACVGVEKRRAVAEAPAAQEGGEEGGEKMLMTKVTRVRSSTLEPIFDEINITVENWRLGGQYVDGADLMLEFVMVCERKVSELKRSKFFIHQKFLSAIEKRLKAIQNGSKNNEYTLRQMLNHFNVRLMKPPENGELIF